MILTFFVVLLNKLIALDKYNKSDGKIRMKNLPFFFNYPPEYNCKGKKREYEENMCVCVCVQVFVVSFVRLL